MTRIQLIGAEALASLMRDDRAEAPDLGWLLWGPTDDAVVETEPPPARLLAAE